MEGPGGTPRCVQGQGVAQQGPELITVHYLSQGWAGSHNVHQAPNNLQEVDHPVTPKHKQKKGTESILLGVMFIHSNGPRRDHFHQFKKTVWGSFAWEDIF